MYHVLFVKTVYFVFLVIAFVQADGHTYTPLHSARRTGDLLDFLPEPRSGFRSRFGNFLSKYQEPRSGSGAVLVGNVGSPEPFPNSGNSAGMKNPFCEH